MSVIEELIYAIQKDFGPESAMLLNSKPRKIPVITTGIPQLDTALGVGGLPKGRIVEIYGPESSGKTTLALQCVASAQKSGPACYIDAEHSLDPKYAKELGVDVDTLILCQPMSGEEGLQIVEKVIDTRGCSIVVVDSVASLVPKAELRGEIGDAHIGLQARLMSQALRILSGKLAKSKTILIFINQIREKIGVTWGSPEVTPGGRALKFYASIRIDVRRIGKEGDDNIGNKTRITVKKNKVAPPFKIAEAVLIFGKGFDLAYNFLPAAMALGIIIKKGNTYSFSATSEKLGVGKKQTAEALALYDKDELLKMLEPNEEEKIKTRITKYENKLSGLEDGEKREKWEKRLEKAKAKLEVLNGKAEA